MSGTCHCKNPSRSGAGSANLRLPDWRPGHAIGIFFHLQSSDEVELEPSLLPEPLIRALAGRYRIDRELGHGGMARVLLAHDLKHGRDVAIKVLRPELAALIGADRFLAEIQTTAKLQHLHILPLFDSGAAEGHLYYVMPSIEGGSLRDRLDRNGAMPLDEVARLITEVGSALDYSHRQGIIHRDIKPENILLHDGSALLADFGIARMAARSADERITETGHSVGTPLYMSPEQASGEPDLTRASDIYSLGVVAYELVSGTVPFKGPTMQAILAQLFTTAPPPLHPTWPGIPEVVDSAILKALAKRPADRFESAGAFAAALQAGASEPALRVLGAGRRSTGPGRITAMVAGTLLVVAAGWWVARGLGSRGDTPTVPKLLAVLPFANETRDSSKDYFGRGLAVEITDELHRLGIGVVGSSAATLAAHRFTSGTEVDIQAAGRSLGADAVLDGTLLPDAGGGRVTLQLTDVRRQVVLWSESYRLGGDLFTLQDAVARQVAHALQVTLTPSQFAVVRRGRSEDPVAHELVVRAKGYAAQRTDSALAQAVPLFTAALTRDSLYAEAWAGLAEAYNLRAVFSAVRPGDYFRLATVAADRALTLDSTSATAHRVRGFLDVFRTQEWAHGDEEFRRALAIDSLDPETWLFRTWYFMAMRKPDSMLASIRRARALDSLTPIFPVRLADVYYLLDADSSAERELRGVLHRDSTNRLALLSRAPVLARLGQCGQALSGLTSSLWRRWGNIGVQSLAIRTWARCGQLGRVRALLREGEVRAAADSVVGGVNLAIGAIYLGDDEAMYRWLDFAIRTHDWELFFVSGNPEFEPFRSEPRFQALLRRAGLPTR